MVEFLAGRGWGAEAVRVVEEAAEVGMRLEQDATGVRSRLGGHGLLPPDVEWPFTDGGRPLSFLAGIDLSELPLQDDLPAAGWLLFFADLDNDNAEGLIDSASNAEGSKARLFYLPAGVEPVEVLPPAMLQDVLLERRVRAAVQLTLPDDYEVAERLGLDAGQAQAYEELCDRLHWGDQDWVPGDPDHWVLGAWSGVQGHPAEPGTVLLLQIASDPLIDFEFLDAGLIQFRIPTDCLRTGRWDEAVVEADSA